MSKVTAVLSMLHEPAAPCSATRLFRTVPVLWWTLQRLKQCKRITQIAMLCWEDQSEAVEPVAWEQGASVWVHGPRAAVPSLDAVTAARKWADGWRGGLFNTCEFDRGFHGPWIEEIGTKTGAHAVLLIDPAAGMVDPVLVDRLIEHADAQAEVEMCFSQAAPGLSGVLVRPEMLKQLAAKNSHPGLMLAYRPDVPRRDLIATEACAPIPLPIARTTHRFTLDSERMIARASAATVGLNGQLLSTNAEGLLATFSADGYEPALPREVVLEINTARATRPIYWPGRHLSISREPLPAAKWRNLFDQLAGTDDLRLTIAGVGDPLLSPDWFPIIRDAKQAGVHAISLETDFFGIEPAAATALAESDVDVVSVHLPAATAATYQAVMGVDGIKAVVENIRLFVERRRALGRGTPLLVPAFTKCQLNLAEMEPWYDHWLRVLGTAVIIGPSDYAKQIPDVAVADMTPPRRKACARIASRMTVLCDGRVVSCEQDVLGAKPLGRVGEQPIEEIWRKSFGALRADHARGEWNKHGLCSACREWHRP